MEYITTKLSLERFFTLLSFDTKFIKTMTPDEIEQLRQDYLLIHTYFSSDQGKAFTKMFRSAVIGKCSSLNGVLLKHSPKDNVIDKKVFVKY